MVNSLLATRGIFVKQQEVNVLLVKLCDALSNDQLGLLSLFANSSLIADEQMREDCLRRIARMESSREQTEAMVASLEQRLKATAPGTTAPGASEQSGT